MTEAPKLRVLVVEDNYLTRLGTVTLLGTQPDLQVVAEAGDGHAALAAYEAHAPDVVVLDLKMPGLDGEKVLTALAARRPPPRVLVLSYYEGDQNILRALQLGALGYLTKGVDASEFLTAVRTVAAGKRYLPSAIATRLAERVLDRALSQRELQVLESLAAGASNRDIARALAITERTVAMFVSNILEKLDARSRTEAVAVALRRGIIAPPGGS